MKLYSSISLIFLIWLISILFISFFGFLTLPHSGYFKGDFWQSLSNWDGEHYLKIAQFGYRDDAQYAFFPLYPLTVRTVYQLTGNYLLAAVLISLTAAFLGMQLLYKLALMDFDRKIAEKVILALVFFPTSFYFLAAYSESLFFLLVVATFYFLRSNKILLATLIAALASATRVVGIALVVSLIINVWIRDGINKKNWYVLLAPAGLLVYCWFLFNQTGDPFYFLTAQTNWHRSLTPPIVGFWQTIKDLSSPGFITGNFNAFLDLMFAIFGLGLMIRAFRFLPFIYSLYGLISVLIPLFTPLLSSMPRFLLPVFPIFILIALLKNKYLILGYQIISLMLLSILTALFINGYWVA